jgi:hypothetical protein
MCHNNLIKIFEFIRFNLNSNVLKFLCRAVFIITRQNLPFLLDFAGWRNLDIQR